MQFIVLKYGFDGISGGNSQYETIDEVLREISWFKGWDSREQLHNAIRTWAENGPKPGSVFATQVTAIVAVALDPGIHSDDMCTECGYEGMDYGELNPVEDGSIVQEVACPECGRRWEDKFVLLERNELFKKRHPAEEP